MGLSLKSWIDIENAPQVQYLAPFKLAFEARGHDVLVTARDQSITVPLLRSRGIDPVIVGGATGSSRPGKLANVTWRATRLARLTRSYGADLLVSASRPANLASWSLQIPSFQFSDYEFTSSAIARWTRAFLLFPDVIDSTTMLGLGFRADRLRPYPGLKESISFAGIAIDEIAAHPLPHADQRQLVKVLVRPPAETAHYFVEESLALTLDLLAVLSRREDIVVVYLPRYPSQISYLERFSWANDPVVLQEAVPFVPLLKAVDAVVSSGGTLLREASYLGIPSFSILQSEIGQVDRYLESIGRLRILEAADDFDDVALKRAALDPLPNRTPDIVGALADSMISIAERQR